jgi:hypothetical protein
MARMRSLEAEAGVAQASCKRRLNRKGWGDSRHVTRNIGPAAIDSYFNEQRDLRRRPLEALVGAHPLSTDVAHPAESAKLAFSMNLAKNRPCGGGGFGIPSVDFEVAGKHPGKLKGREMGLSRH